MLTEVERTTFSGAFGTGALYKLSKADVIFNVFINIGLYIIFTLICFYLARPPLFLARYINPRVTKCRLPERAQRIFSVKKMSKEQTIAVCFCGAAKTTSLGIPLVTAMWSQADDLTRAFITIPVLLYTIEQVSAAPAYFSFLLICLVTDWAKRCLWRKFWSTFLDGTCGAIETYTATM